MLVRQILASKARGAEEVVTVAPEQSVAEAARLLSDRHIGALMVSADGRQVVGVLSERDIVRELGRRGSGCLDEQVDALMTRVVMPCAPDDQATAVLQQMTDGRFRHMPVLEGGLLIGVISIGDVVKARLDELAMEKDALEGMIMGF